MLKIHTMQKQVDRPRGGKQSERFDRKRTLYANAVLSIMYTVMGFVLRPIKYRPMSDSETDAAA